MQGTRARLPLRGGDAIDDLAAAASRHIAGKPHCQCNARTLQLPVIGKVQASDLSLPVLTIAMAAIDGFNPCAMWVLVFLLGLLLDIRNRRRMWLLAATFLLATAPLYFLFLAAWLNIILVLGALAWLCISIGMLAMVAGGHYLRGALQREQVCEVTRPECRRKVLDRLRRLVQEPSLAVSMIGVALLAMAVNLVELACSAGTPPFTPGSSPSRTLQGRAITAISHCTFSRLRRRCRPRCDRHDNAPNDVDGRWLWSMGPYRRWRCHAGIWGLADPATRMAGLCLNPVVRQATITAARRPAVPQSRIARLAYPR